MRRALLLSVFLLAACGSASSQPPPLPAGTKIDRLVVDKSARVLIGYSKDREVVRYANIRFGDQPKGHKRFEGEERTPEGNYIINGRNPKSAYHLSLRISYPNAADSAFAKAHGRSPGGDIFIHGQPNRWPGSTLTYDWTDGCIALADAEIRQLWDIVPDGIPIAIRP